MWLVQIPIVVVWCANIAHEILRIPFMRVHLYLNFRLGRLSHVTKLICLSIFIFEALSWFFIFLPDEPKSVYVRNLPPTITEEEIEQEFKDFGKIIPDGVFIRLRKVGFSFLIVTSLYVTLWAAKIAIDLYRKLEFAMPLLSSKTLLVFKMHSRFVFLSLFFFNL